MSNSRQGEQSEQIERESDFRRLIACFDGTWNTLESQTNVSRLFRALATAETGCPTQLAFYDEGVGTERGQQIRGGGTGEGLDDNVLEGYCWLINNYKFGGVRPDSLDHVAGVTSVDLEEQFAWGDEIFLFGFSRGAFTARSLAGLINRVGLLDRSKLGLPAGEPVTTDMPRVRDAWRLYKTLADPNAGPARYQEPFASFRRDHSHDVKIACVGVWDSVGALGLPAFGGNVPWAKRGKFKFHDTKLGRVIEHAYHALAIDEHRPDFSPTLWTAAPGDVAYWRDLEQRWFPGAHANVGGGYDDDLLCEAPLYWMARKASALGVVFRRDRDTPPYHSDPPPEFRTDGNEYLSPVRDSYKEMGGGWYGRVAGFFGGRTLRRMLVAADGIGQQVDPSARLKWDLDPDYRPKNLAQAGRTDTNTPPASREELQLAQGARI